MAFSNTFISLDDVDITSLGAGKFLRVRPSGNVEISQTDIDLNIISDVNTSGAYTPSAGQVLTWNSAGEWRPASADVYSMGNGLNKSGLTLNVTAGVGGGLVANSNGVYIEDIANIAGTYGNSSYVPTFTVNSKGQITGVTPVATTVEEAQSLNASYVGNVVGTSGQISVTGGTGQNSNATLNLVATGVTSGVYGNTTHIPQITVDSYGRIQNVDMVNVTGNVSGGSGGNVQLAYKNIAVSGQTTLSADEAEDTLTFEGGTGFDWTTTPSQDKITISANATALAGLLELSGLNDVDATGITNGQVLIWNSSTSKFEAGDQTGSGGGSNVTLTDFSVVTNSPSGNGALSYDNAGVFTFTPANVSSGGGVTQSLSWNVGTSTLSISSGNSVDLSALEQTLSLDNSTNVITISGSSSTIDLSTVLGNVEGTYGNLEVQAYLDAQGYSNVDNDAQTLSLSANIITISGSNSTVDVGKTRFYYANQTDFPSATTYHGAIAHSHADAAMYFAHGGSWNKLANNSDLSSYQTTTAATTANTNMQAYVDALETRIIGGANVNLDSLAEVANALANSNTELSTVAFTGTYGDLQSRPTLTLANSDLTYDGTTVDLSGVGAQGPQGNAGADGVSVTNADATSGNLIITLSDASTVDAGNVVGPQGATGATGPQGDGNAGISSASIDGSGNLILTLNDATTVDAGNVKGDKGDTGDTGVGITSTSLVGGNLVLNYSNTSTQDVGNIQGPQGDAGTNGVDVSSATVNGSGNLILTLSDASTIDAGNVKGADGDVDQTISLVGNVLTISGSNSNVDFTSALAVNTDSQTLSLVSNTLSISGGNSVDLSSFAGGGGLADLSSNVLADLSDVSSESPTDGQALVWDNGNSVWAPGTVSSGGGDITAVTAGVGLSGGGTTGDVTVDLANTSVTPGTYGSATKSARITVDQQGRITNVTESTISGGGGGSGATIEQFRLNYNSSGNLAGTANVSSGITGVTINSATGGEVTVSFDSGTYNLPPGAIMFYGYDYTNNKYNMIPFDTSVTYHEIPAGGTSGSPTLFDGGSTVQVKLRLRESETGAGRGGFGTTTHAFIRFVMYD